MKEQRDRIRIKRRAQELEAELVRAHGLIRAMQAITQGLRRDIAKRDAEMAAIRPRWLVRLLRWANHRKRKGGA